MELYFLILTVTMKITRTQAGRPVSYTHLPKDEEPTKDNTAIGVSWEHGIYLGSTLSQTNFKAYKREYGTPEKIKDVYDYRAKRCV